MKKTYVKPQIVFESFQLSTSIAASCDLLGSQSAQYVCPVTDPETEFTIFTELCDTVPVGGNDSICYNVSEQNWTVFSS